MITIIELLGFANNKKLACFCITKNINKQCNLRTILNYNKGHDILNITDIWKIRNSTT